jgi:hypothetical protein
MKADGGIIITLLWRVKVYNVQTSLAVLWHTPYVPANYFILTECWVFMFSQQRWLATFLYSKVCPWMHMPLILFRLHDFLNVNLCIWQRFLVAVIMENTISKLISKLNKHYFGRVRLVTRLEIVRAERNKEKYLFMLPFYIVIYCHKWRNLFLISNNPCTSQF